MLVSFLFPRRFGSATAPWGVGHVGLQRIEDGGGQTLRQGFRVPFRKG